MNKPNSSNDLNNQINKVRKLMILAGISKGFTDSETLKYSQELDKLIIKHQKQLLDT